MLQFCSNKSFGLINVKLIYAKINNVLTIYHYFDFFFLYHYFYLVFYGTLQPLNEAQRIN